MPARHYIGAGALPRPVVLAMIRAAAPPIAVFRSCFSRPPLDVRRSKSCRSGAIFDPAPAPVMRETVAPLQKSFTGSTTPEGCMYHI